MASLRMLPVDAEEVANRPGDVFTLLLGGPGERRAWRRGHWALKALNGEGAEGGEQAASRRRADGEQTPLLGAQGHYRRENWHFSWQFRDENQRNATRRAEFRSTRGAPVPGALLGARGYYRRENR